MSPVFAVALGMIGAAVLARWCVREARRVNAELDNLGRSEPAQPIDRDSLPTLKRDPKTGEYRPG